MNDRRRRREPTEHTATADITAERHILGLCIASADTFWKTCDRLQPDDFYHARHARIWTAMLKCAERQKPPLPNLIVGAIRGDKDEDVALPMFLQIVKEEALQNADAIKIEVQIETVQNLSQRRAIIAALEGALVEAKTAEFGMAPEAIRSMAMGNIAATMTAVAGDRYLQSYGDHAQALAQQISDDKARPIDWTRGLQPGLKAVEEVTGPLLPGKVYVLGGLSSGGKTALASNIMEAAAADAKRKGLGWIYNASMEMTGTEHAARHLAVQLGLTSFKIERSQVTESEYEAIATRGVQSARALPIWIDRFPRMTLDNIRTRMISQKHRGGLAMGIIDHLLLVRSGKRDSLNDRVMEAMIEIKLLAGELDIPMLVLSQVNEKEVMARPSLKPQASDLYGSQAIQQNADVTFFVHRPEVPYRKKGPKDQTADAIGKWETRLDAMKGKAIIYSDKGRSHGGGTERDVLFDGPSISFRDV